MQVIHTGHAQVVTFSVIPGVLSSFGFLEIFFLLGTTVESVSLEEEWPVLVEDLVSLLAGMTSSSMVSWPLVDIVKPVLSLWFPHSPPLPRSCRTQA